MRIYWEKYKDLIAEMGKYPEKDEADDDGYGAEREEILSEYENNEKNKYERPKVYDGPLVVTNFGLMATNQRSLTTSKYSIWIGRTKEDITNTHLKLMNQAYGVEILSPISRYSFLVGCGPQFNNREVRKAIEQAVSEKEVANSQSRIDQIRLGAYSSYGKTWAIVQSLEGHLELVGGKTKDEVLKGVESFGELWSVVESPLYNRAKPKENNGKQNPTGSQ